MMVEPVIISYNSLDMDPKYFVNFDNFVRRIEGSDNYFWVNEIEVYNRYLEEYNGKIIDYNDLNAIDVIMFESEEDLTTFILHWS